VHSVAMLPDSLDEEALLKIYRTVVSAAFELLGIDISVYDKVDLDAEQMDDAVPSHNLLLTRRWILCVPRANEMFEGVGANSVGFAGWLLATDEAGLSKLKEQGPLYFLQNLGHRL
jgi:ATP adenylyltransferase